MEVEKRKILFLVTEDWYFCSHRLPIARMAKKNGFDVTVATRVTNHGEQILREGFKLIPLRMRRRGHGLVSEFLSLLQLVHIFHTEGPVLVHFVAMKPVLFGGLAARFCRIPVVISALTGLGYVFTSKQTKAIVLRRIFHIVLKYLLTRQKSWVIVQNADDHKVVASIMNSFDKVALIPGSGVDLSRFSFSHEIGGEITVCMISRMLWDKGVGVLVDAARIIKKSGKVIRVVLVGSPDHGNPDSVSEKQLREWHKDGLVEWWGNRDDIPEIWGQVHIAVLPSFYGEGVPKTLLEAAACGRAIITTDSPGCRDVVKHGETGLLIPKKDANALAQAIIQLAENTVMRQQMGEAGHQRVKEFFSEELVVQKTEALYRKALNGLWPS